MKSATLSTLILLLLPTPLYAAPYALRCSTDPATNSVAIEEVGDEIRATVLLEYGAEYAPALAGDHTPHDLPLLAERARLASKLKPVMTFYWPRQKCEFPADGRIECFGTGDAQDGQDGAKFTPFAVYTTNVTEQGLAGKQESTRVTLALYSEGKSVDLKLEYPAGSCWR
jgi:hypothetical protein